MAKAIPPGPENKSRVDRFIGNTVLKTLRTAISTIKPGDWMSALQPLMPYIPYTFGRQWDFRVGRNINYIPRGEEQITFPMLRNFARRSEIVRFAIETRKDQLCAQKWQIKPKIDSQADDDDPRIKRLEAIFRKPDGVTPWHDWYRMGLEELFVTDAFTIYRQPNRGRTFNYRIIDGSTIFPLIDDLGYTPMPPDPAFQQIIKGVPKSNYTTDEMLYLRRNVRVYTSYGFPPVEQCIMSCKTDIERAKNQLAYFTAGSVPDAYMTMAEGVPSDQIAAFEDKFNSLLAGNAEGKRQVPFVPFGSKLEQTKAPALKDEYDEWIARKICFCLSIPPTPFIKQLNRSTSETSKDQALQEGQGPVIDWTEKFMTNIIAEDFGIDDLEFAFLDEKEQDPQVQDEIIVNDVKSALISINEGRAAKGLDPSSEPAADELMALTATGWVPLPGSKLAEQINQDKLDALAAQPASVAGPGGPSGKQPAKPGAKPAAKPNKPAEKAARHHKPLTFRAASRYGEHPPHGKPH